MAEPMENRVKSYVYHYHKLFFHVFVTVSKLLLIAYKAKMIFHASPLCITCVLVIDVLINWLTC